MFTYRTEQNQQLLQKTNSALTFHSPLDNTALSDDVRLSGRGNVAEKNERQINHKTHVEEKILLYIIINIINLPLYIKMFLFREK